MAKKPQAKLRLTDLFTYRQLPTDVWFDTSFFFKRGEEKKYGRLLDRLWGAGLLLNRVVDDRVQYFKAS